MSVTFPVLVQGGLVWLATNTWGETCKSIINDYYPYEQNSIRARLAYAVFVTVMVIVIISIIKTMNKAENTCKEMLGLPTCPEPDGTSVDLSKKN